MQRTKRVILKGIHVTEKSSVIQGLVEAESNPCLKKCKTPKFVFLVDPKANKAEIRKAVEAHFEKQAITVIKVNTITLPRKKKRSKGTRKMGTTDLFKKAIVTLKEGNTLNLEA